MSDRQERLSRLTPEMREVIAENMKERVYSTITLIAVLTVMWQHPSSHSPFGAIMTILGSVAALWAATLISIRMSYRAVNGKPISSTEYRKTFFTSSGLLAPAIAPILIIAIGAVTGLWGLQASLFAGMIVSLLQLFFLSFSAGRQIYDNTWRLLVMSLLETSVGVGIILLKIAVGE